MTLFQTDRPFAPFLAEILDGLVRFFMEKFILKCHVKAHSSISLTKFDQNGVTKQKPSCLVDLVFAVNYEMLKSKKKVIDIHLVRCKKEAVDFWRKFVLTLLKKVNYCLILLGVPDAYHRYLLQSVQTLLEELLKKFHPNSSILKPLLLLLLTRQNQSITSL